MSVFVIFSADGDGELSDSIIGFTTDEQKAIIFCDTRNHQRNMKIEINKKYYNKIKEYQEKISTYIEENQIKIYKLRDEYVKLLKKPLPDLSKVPQERHHILNENYNNKVGNRLKELELFMSMSQLEIEEYNKNVYRQSLIQYGKEPEERSNIPVGDEYYYKEVQELP